MSGLVDHVLRGLGQQVHEVRDLRLQDVRQVLQAATDTGHFQLKLSWLQASFRSFPWGKMPPCMLIHPTGIVTTASGCQSVSIGPVLVMTAHLQQLDLELGELAEVEVEQLVAEDVDVREVPGGQRVLLEHRAEDRRQVLWLFGVRAGHKK